MDIKRLIIALFGIAGAIFVPKLSAILNIIRGQETIAITASYLAYAFLGILVLALLTGAVQKRERIPVVLLSLIIIGLPIFILWTQKIVFNVNVLEWLLLTIIGLVFTMIWIRQMFQDDKK